jgi:hypothetical protein
VKQILICGDSFAADWTVKYPGQGWPNKLAQDHQVTNIAQAGCGEYKILKQLQSIDLNKFDTVIVSHTSPYRIYVHQHPVHQKDSLHVNSDLIYADIQEHAKTDRSLKCVVDFFEQYFDTDYACFVHGLICEKIDQLLQEFKGTVLHITNIDWNNLYQFPDMISYADLFETHRGTMNHYDEHGNKEIYQQLSRRI